MGFVKVWDFILNSSILEEKLAVRWVWVVILTMADRDGMLRTTREALARKAKVPLRQVNDALAVLLSPDPASTTDEEDGRRLLKTGTNEYFVVNYQKYREMRDDDDERAKTRERVRRHRERKIMERKTNTKTNTNADVTPCNACNANAEAEAEAEAEDIAFGRIWYLVPIGRKVARAEAQHLWESRKNTTSGKKMTAADRKLAFERYPAHVNMWRRERRQTHLIPHLRTWLYQRRWEDDIPGVEVDDGHGLAWMFDVYRRSDYEEHSDHEYWGAYLEFATAWTDEHGPRTAMPFSEWFLSRRPDMHDPETPDDGTEK